MSDHFIRKIEIKNYKLFQNFKAEGFGRANLISGKNNVGKTAFLEAGYINIYPDSIATMTDVLTSPKLARNYLEIGLRFLTEEEKKNFLEAASPYEATTNIQQVKFSIFDEQGIKQYFFKFGNEQHTINLNEFSFERRKRDNIRFITQLGFVKTQMKQVFEFVQRLDKEESLNQFIHDFDSNIINFKLIGGDSPQCKTKKGEYQDINEFGDGFKRYISFICSLYATANGYLFIDEIENGIHYTNYDKLWEIILTLSKEQNVQVFATTHSKECIESYARVAKRLEDEEITFIEMGRNKNNEIRAIVMDSKRFYDELEIGNEVRGW